MQSCLEFEVLRFQCMTNCRFICLIQHNCQLLQRLTKASDSQRPWTFKCPQAVKLKNPPKAFNTSDIFFRFVTMRHNKLTLIPPRCSRRTSFPQVGSSPIQSRPLIAFGCVAVLPPSVMVFFYC